MTDKAERALQLAKEIINNEVALVALKVQFETIVDGKEERYRNALMYCVNLLATELSGPVSAVSAPDMYYRSTMKILYNHISPVLEAK
jgi:hypothetical protein